MLYESCGSWVKKGHGSCLNPSSFCLCCSFRIIILCSQKYRKEMIWGYSEMVVLAWHQIHSLALWGKKLTTYHFNIKSKNCCLGTHSHPVGSESRMTYFPNTGSAYSQGSIAEEEAGLWRHHLPLFRFVNTLVNILSF